MGENLRFYNLLVHIVGNNKLTEENAALKNIWNREGSIMLDLYFYRLKTSKVIDAAYVHDVLDLTTEKYYLGCKELLSDYNKYLLQEKEKSVALQKKQKERAYQYDFKLMEDIKDDIIILVFVSRCTNYYSEIKKKTIRAYIEKILPDVKNMSAQYINAYLEEINPNEADFYKALENLSRKTPEEAETLARETVKICISDGVMAYNEKILIAELLQTLREQGLEPDVGL